MLKYVVYSDVEQNTEFVLSAMVWDWHLEKKLI